MHYDRSTESKKPLTAANEYTRQCVVQLFSILTDVFHKLTVSQLNIAELFEPQFVGIMWLLLLC